MYVAVCIAEALCDQVRNQLDDVFANITALLSLALRICYTNRSMRRTSHMSSVGP